MFVCTYYTYNILGENLRRKLDHLQVVNQNQKPPCLGFVDYE